MKISLTTLGLALVIGLVAIPATAETYTITMTNGTTFQSRYDPVEAPWDESKIYFLNELGTHMTLPKADIANVITATEVSGFGRVIDSTTLDLGILLVDVPDTTEEDPEELERRRFEQYMDESNPRYNVDQFVDPADAGTSGLPAWGGGGSVVPPSSGGI